MTIPQMQYKTILLGLTTKMGRTKEWKIGEARISRGREEEWLQLESETVREAKRRERKGHPMFLV